MSSPPYRSARGCYGLTLRGIDGANAHLVDAGEGWPIVTVSQHRKLHAGRPDEHLDDETAILHLSDRDSFAQLERRAGTVHLHTQQIYDDEALLHPMLSSSCAIMNRWVGRDSFHAGAFVVNGRAWAVIGDRGQGKSTTLGYLAAAGHTIVTDDLVVVERGCVLVGPAFVDLRPDAATFLGLGRDLGHLGARPRYRHYLPARAFDKVPLAGWLLLAWGSSVALDALPVSERIGVLYANRVVRREPTDAATYLSHAACPVYRLTRPQTRDSLVDVLALVRSRLA